MKFLVIGDLMLDRYSIGEVNRISPEAPVPIVNIKYQYDVLGGAANCARNISTITGKETVDIMGFFNPNDEAGKEIHDLLIEEGIYFYVMDFNRPTTLKERIFAGNQQLIRIDTEFKDTIPFDSSINFKKIKLYEYDYIVVSDYAKGVVSKDLMDFISPFSYKTIIDPKPVNSLLYPSNSLLITPNEHEHEKMRYKDPKYILVTRGKNGMSLYSCNNNDNCEVDSIKINNVVDVIGAGDTVTAIMAICFQRGCDVIVSSKIANRCAAYVVSQSGTSVCPKDVFELIYGDEINK
jgi:D-glycero-beta-D-manno-heptose-7-phosphate kinase